MLQPSEVVGLVVAVVLLPIIITSSRTIWAPLRRLMLATMGSIIAGNTFTVIEGFVLPDLFNVLEHASFAIAGVFVFAALLSLRRVPVLYGGVK